ncbi:MAG TPA: hypothetical protein VMZ24_02500 [Patescibacteria group bacterium]|nr:hypothetical protein [Patescibacteria group bacterium]
MSVLTFKSLEEKQKAIETLGDVDDAPAGTVIDDKYLSEYDQKLEALMNSKVDPEHNPEETPPETPPEPKPEPEKPDPIVQATAPLRSEIERLRAENAQRDAELKQRQKEFEDKIAELQKQKPAEKQDEVVPPSKYEAEITDVEKEIERLEQEIASVPEDEYEKKLSLLNEKTKKYGKINTLMRKAQFEAIKQSNKELAEIKEKEEKRKKDSERTREIEEANRKRDQARTERIKEAEAFRKIKTEFQSEKSYDEMEREYSTFSQDVASRYYGRSPDRLSPEEIEIAMQSYMDKSPVLMGKIADLQEPKDFKKYMLLTEVESARLGLTLDKYTGKWYQRKDSYGNKVVLPDLETAYDYVKKVKGITAAEIAELQKKTAAEVKKAMERRTDPGEIDAPHSGENADDGMTVEMAQKVIAEYDEEKTELMARQSIVAGKPLPREVQYINRALSVLKLDPITGQN